MIALIRIVDPSGQAHEHRTPAVSRWALDALIVELRSAYAGEYHAVCYGYSVWQEQQGAESETEGGES